jgi:hypothetical protein
LLWGVGAVLSEDAFVGDAAGDLDSGLVGDLAQNLVEAGVAGGDKERTGGVGDLSVVGRELRGGWGRRRRGGWDGGSCCGLGCRESG